MAWPDTSIVGHADNTPGRPGRTGQAIRSVQLIWYCLIGKYKTRRNGRRQRASLGASYTKKWDTVLGAQLGAE